MVEVVDVIVVKIELEEFSGSIFTSITSTTSTWSSKASYSSSGMSSFWTMCVGRLWYYLLNRTGWASLNFKETKWKYLSPRLSYVLVLFDSAIMTLNLENSPMNSVGEDGCSRQQPSSSTGPSGCTRAGLGDDAYGACAGRSDVTAVWRHWYSSW